MLRGWRRPIIPALLLLLAWTLPAGAQQGDTEATIARFAFPPEQVGYMVVDLATG